MATTATQKRKESSGTRSEGTPAATDAAKRHPIRTLRNGDCSASIWSRDAEVRGEAVRFYSVTLERSYKDRDGAWKYTKSLDADSLGAVTALCQQAAEVIDELRRLDARAAE